MSSLEEEISKEAIELVEEILEDPEFQMHSKEQHPLASSHWDEVAFANHEDEINAEIEERLERWRTKTKQ